MTEPFVNEGHARNIEAISDFCVLKKLVDADMKGSLFAKNVIVECGLLDEPYDDVVSLVAKISKSHVTYQFVNAEVFTVKTMDDWVKLKEASGFSDVEAHVFSEIEVDAHQFNEMKELLKKSNCLLVDMNRLNKSTSCVGLSASRGFH